MLEFKILTEHSSRDPTNEALGMCTKLGPGCITAAFHGVCSDVCTRPHTHIYTHDETWTTVLT